MDTTGDGPCDDGSPDVEAGAACTAAPALVTLIDAGRSAAEAADLLGLSLCGVQEQLTDLRRAYGTTSTAEAVRRARARPSAEESAAS